VAIAEILKGNPKYLRSTLAQGHAHNFPLGVVLWWALANPNCMPNLKLLASAIAQMLKENPKILGSSSSSGPHTLFLRCWIL